MGHSGVGGELSEILSILRACLQVGRLERAGVILKRIDTLEVMNDEQLLQLHNEYIQAAVYELYTKPRPAAIQTLHKWFELEIRNKELPLNAETIAFMLKASLQTPAGMRRNRLVRRYMDIGKQKDLGLEVLGQSSILSAEDLNEITHICPDYNSKGPMLKDFSDSLESDEVESLYEEATNVEPAVPDVRTTKQKGLGLKSLKQSLSLFSQETSMNLNLQNRSIEEKRMIQAQLEEDGITAAIQRWREENAHLTEIGFDTALQTKSCGARMWKWQLALDQALKNELEKVAEAEGKHRIIADDVERVAYGPFLRILPTEKLAALTILSCMTALSSGGVDKGMTLSSSIMAIAKSVEEECAFEATQANLKIKSNFGGAKAEEMRRFSATQLRKSIRLRGSNSRPAPDLTDGATEAIDQRTWPTAIKAKVGAFLMSALIETAKIPVTLEHPETKQVITQLQPAFSHSHQYKMGKKVGMVIANRKIVEQLKREPVHSLLAKHLPMLVPPEPWTDFDKGGFISHPAKIMRIKHGDKDQRHYAEAAIDNGDMTQTFKGLDVLGKTSWRINRPVFDVMLEAWNSGEAIANIAAENPKFEVPPEPEASNDPLERRKWIRAVKLVENAKSGLHSQRCFQNFQLEIARALRNHEFFFPHNIDFRGRAYPIPPYFNHMGADHCRGILKFGRGRELGESGLKWLKVHLANVFGYDKASLKEREAFAEENITSIYDSASKPLNGSRWWLKAEDPWQCLAACMELKNALESPEPTKFVSHLPVHQDGTCNGLQHYAALGGDAWGAQQVNLEPGDRPADVYSAVANLVKESIAADKEKGNPYAQILAGRITRKVVKQTVMTNVYGVTYVGAKAQVRKQLVAAYPDLPNDETVNPGVLSAYVATKIFTALSTMFRGAHDIQYWLGECASRITRSLTPEQMDRLEGDWPTTALGPPTERRTSQRSVFGVALEDPGEFRSSVIWTTPLHMPVVQPYRQSKTRMVQTNMQSISLSEPHRSSPISRRKQLQGFPPNFIHSLDATHMLLSALKCDEQGLTFAAVHDSFWTHASDVDSMNSILRDAFIRIHSENVIGRLAGEFRARYKESMYLTKIRSGSALYKKIISLRRTRPKTSKPIKLAELLVERKRCRLLQSSDPAEVEEGKKMVTPGSLFEEMAREEDLSPEKDLANIGIGEISQRESRVHSIQETDFSGVGDHEDANPLPDNILAETGSGEEAEENQELDDEAESDILSGSSRAFAKKVLPTRRSPASMHTWVWLPLTFPSIPQKARSPFSPNLYKVARFLTMLQGDFDVSRLKNSEYFFS
ncbi:hypothetical protein OIDMADRAFT_125253 [Oidiodendron maius Zn]|uniref:DNA-directed RNA polymerase n=1 Tax=Oidiodendron maius (strain Zn) TaxID=913774 RepID=A0A0C3DEL1_OIDMZ|nr:hypothetical protein OIDMADRAFT_125253 [Oidiodendron maius Zn]